VKGYQPEKSILDKVEKAALMEEKKAGLVEIEKLNAAMAKVGEEEMKN